MIMLWGLQHNFGSGEPTFHSSTSKTRPSAFSLSAFSLFSAASRSLSNSFSSSSLETLNSASSVSSCSYCDLYQASESSGAASSPGGDDGGSDANILMGVWMYEEVKSWLCDGSAPLVTKVACDRWSKSEMSIWWSVKEGRRFGLLIRKKG